MIGGPQIKHLSCSWYICKSPSNSRAWESSFASDDHHLHFFSSSCGQQSLEILCSRTLIQRPPLRCGQNGLYTLWEYSKLVFILRGQSALAGFHVSRWHFIEFSMESWTGCTKSGLYSKVVYIPRWSLTRLWLRYYLSVSLANMMPPKNAGGACLKPPRFP